MYSLNNQSDFEHNIIETWVSLMDKSQEDIDKIMSLPSSPEAQSIQAAYYMMQFADRMPGGFFIYRADGDEEILYANHAMLQIFNCESIEEFREWTDNSFKGIVHPEELEFVEQSIKKQLTGGQTDLDHVEYRIIQKDGGIRWLDDYGHFIHSETAGDVFYVFAGDITEKKALEQKEKERQIYMQKLNEQLLNDRIHKYDQELQVIHPEHLRRLETIEGLSIDYDSIFYANLDTDRIKAYRISTPFETLISEEQSQHTFSGFDAHYINNWVHPDDRKLLAGISNPDWIRKKLSKNKNFHVNHRIIRGDKTIYMQLRVVNVGSEEPISKIVLGYRNVDVEIIREMKQSQILTEALNEATLANNAKNLFLSNMSHDIRTPMNAIVGFTSLVQKHIGDTEKTTSYLNMISTASDQLLQLLNDVLEISSLESGKVQLEEEDCNLLEIVYKIKASILPRVEAKNIDLSLDLSQLQHDTVLADAQRLNQLLSYLVDNAVKYANKNGKVVIKIIEQDALQSESDCHNYQFVVEDNGIGIGKNFIDHIFEPFEREKNTTLSGISGTGLGLTIAKDLAEMMGGSIEVSSMVGKGSTFVINLPLHVLEETSAHYNQEDEDEPAPFLTHKRILVVDDNEINLEIENEVLKDAGFLVDTAADGSIALEKIKQSPPDFYDLILMDIQMPIMDGYHAARAIRKLEDPISAGIPIIAVSANAFIEDKKAALESGMNAHLAKPLDTALLYKQIRKLLKEKESDL